MVLGLLFAVAGLLEAPGNPHTDEATACCPAQAIPPDTVLPSALALRRQADTFVSTRRAKHIDREVDVFTFRQPRRLSERMLPFELALVSGIDPSGIVELAADPDDSKDSWFPDYAWSHFIVCTSDANPKHLGWRFTKRSAGGAGPSSFVALIVRAHEQNAAQGVGGNAEELRQGVPLAVGADAPGWMVAMLAAVTARQVST